MNLNWTKKVTGSGVGYVIALLAGAAVFASGTATSFANLARYAREHGWIWGPALPLGLDLGIFALLLLDWLRPSAFLRTSAWALTAGTVLANYAVTDGDRTDRALHAIVILVAVIIFEAARHLRDDATRMDKVRLSRWFLSPWRTARLWRRMVLWEIRSYSDALTRESAILHARTLLAAHYGEGSWRKVRKRVPLTLQHQLTTGQLPSSVLHSLDLQDAVRAWVHETLEDLASSAAGSSPVPAPEPEVREVRVEVPVPAQRDRWDLIWDLRDRLVPDGVPPMVFAKAIAVARAHFEQVGEHIKVADLMSELGTGKPRATKISQVLRSSHTDGPDLWVRTEDPAPGSDHDDQPVTSPASVPAGPVLPERGLSRHPINGYDPETAGV
ncbi:DUF2637 domain-containing protein [Spirillospora sp. NPDC127200]